MKRLILLVLCMILVVLMVPAGKVSAGSVTLSGTLVPGGPTMLVAIITTPNCTGGYGVVQVLYAVYEFSVDTPGIYTFTEPGLQTAMYLYAGSFDPAAAATNCIAASNTNPLNFSFSLVPGQTYFVAVIDDTFAQNGLSYSITINGPGAILLPGEGGCGIVIPAGSVVGEAPLGAQVYYEPGNISPGVVLRPGTYWVLGQDATETYYQVLIACQTVWVRKDTMQPSYLPPQNGAPLPTRIVN